MVIGTITLSYVVFVILTSVNWYVIKWAIVNSGDTQDAIFTAIFNQPPWVTLVNNVCNFLMAALADGLLVRKPPYYFSLFVVNIHRQIWRCFNVWDRSFRAIALPSFLLFCEIGMFLYSNNQSRRGSFSFIGVGLALIIIAGLYNLGTSPSQVDTLNTVLGVATFMTLATTLATTLLISYRIHLVSKQDLPRSVRARLNHIIEILVQSAAAYSIVALASAITVVVPLTADNVAQVFAAETYVSAVYAFTSVRFHNLLSSKPNL